MMFKVPIEWRGLDNLYEEGYEAGVRAVILELKKRRLVELDGYKGEDDWRLHMGEVLINFLGEPEVRGIIDSDV